MKSISLYLKVASKPSLYLERLNFSPFLGIEEIRKDYKRIVLYLCSQMDVNSAEHGFDSTDDEYSAEEDKAKRAKLQIKNDEELARKLQLELDKDVDAGEFVDDGKRDDKSLPDVAIMSPCSEVVEGTNVITGHKCNNIWSQM